MKTNQHPEHGFGKEKIDSAGDTFWYWSLRPQESNSFPGPTVQLSETRADDETLHRVYSEYLMWCPFDVSLMKALSDRGLTPDQIDDLRRRKYKNHPDKGRAKIIRKMIKNGILESDLAQTPGFVIAEHQGRRYWTTSRLIGMIVPVRNVRGQIVSLKVRQDDPGKGGKYKPFSSSGKQRNGSSPGSPVHFPLFDGDTSTIRITEGQLKADIATMMTGILTIGLNAAGSWKRAAKAVKAQNVLVAYDADHRTNPSVRRALINLVQSLKKNGFNVSLEIWI